VSDTLIERKNRVTLPKDVIDAAGLAPGDRIAWRFEAGEIRGRKLIPEEHVPLVKARRVNGEWVGANIRLDREAIVAAIRADRDRR